jgi:hypothetical protein
MGDDGPGGRRLPCPCSARRARVVRMRAVSALAAAGLVALAVLGTSSAPVRAEPAATSVSLPAGHGGGSAAGRIMLIAIAVIALGVFAVLQVIARSQRQRWSAYADWRTWPPGYDPWAGAGDPVAGQHEGSAYRPGYGFLPGHGLAASPARSAYLARPRNVVVPEPHAGVVPEARRAVVPEARRGVAPEAREAATTGAAGRWMRDPARLRLCVSGRSKRAKGAS